MKKTKMQKMANRTIKFLLKGTDIKMPKIEIHGALANCLDPDEYFHGYMECGTIKIARSSFYNIKCKDTAAYHLECLVAHELCHYMQEYMGMEVDHNESFIVFARHFSNKLEHELTHIVYPL